ncbi:predicted protein [Postia placenta Mad-698-R]|uniref:Protein kinase domain-containing protein n=1 Tax=Postia placenta MAD-698-R-SB12 TaxID=670580 RepID=A0A1X6MVW4_9APHY|nr:hypothetical protein POSPLADRAFT_1047943 [Postia placenta MAD-698-R-SB12]EED81131.1 predicted protein [Postia placenta Mad-698-R]OSX60514.1 hypothetical protein POSPLADRAFT_1047943 [Postia placenta MAD-698-R-SB12]
MEYTIELKHCDKAREISEVHCGASDIVDGRRLTRWSTPKFAGTGDEKERSFSVASRLYPVGSSLSMINYERQGFLEAKGYALRPRYRPGWIPSWRGTGEHPMSFEDSISLPDCDDSSVSYMVMPFLRLIDRPEFELVLDIVEFGDQIMTAHSCGQGLVFMHAQGVAHRSRVPIKYYYVDYGLSVYIPPDIHPKLVLGDFGRDQDVPELSLTVPYDPFKVDIFIIGNMLKRIFHDQYSNVGFLLPLIQRMTQHDPASRPNAQEALQQWQSIRRTIFRFHRQWRLQSRSDNWLVTLIRDAIHLRTMVASSLRGLFGWGMELQG